MNLYNKLVPKLYGSGLGKIKPLANFNKYIRSKQKPNITSFYGFDIFLDKYDMSQLSVLGEKGKDYHEISFLQTKISKGNNVIDVGANIGLYTVLFSKWVGDYGKVWSIEPAPDNYSLIQKTINYNKIRNVELILKAVSDYDGKASLDISVDCTGYSMTKIKTKKMMEIQCMKLDNYFSDKTIDFVKIDAEGQELNVLKGMKTLLEKDVKMMIEFEPATHSNTNDPKETLELLESFGYKFTDIGRNGVIIQISKQELLSRKEKKPDLYKNIYCEK